MPALQRARRSTVFETVFLLVVAIGLAIALQAFAVKPYRIPSGSMEPTLHVGDRVLVNRFSHRVLGHDPKIGDIVVFNPPRGADARPACLRPRRPGRRHADAVRAADRREVLADVHQARRRGRRRSHRGQGRARDPQRPPGRRAVHRAVRPGSGTCDFPQEITVPKGHVFMMGDNRGNSDDSRYWGPVPVGWVIGGAFATYWPPSRIGGAIARWVAGRSRRPWPAACRSGAPRAGRSRARRTSGSGRRSACRCGRGSARSA